ncbi:ATP-grasp domain-containing protein [Kaarinaea lacus]
MQDTAHANTKSRILLVAPPDSYRVAPYINAAKRLNTPIEVASNGEYSLINEIASGLHINFSDPAAAIDTIIHAAAQQPYLGIIAADDMASEIAAASAQVLGLPHNPPDAIQFTRWKHKARALLKESGLPVPVHWIANIAEVAAGQIPDVSFPVVAKPINLSASRGVIRANNRSELIEAAKTISRIVSQLSEVEARSTLLIEQFIPGHEIALEGILKNGKLNTIAIFDKPDPLEGPYFEETYYVTPSRLSRFLQEKAIQTIELACQAYGLETGPIHAELRFHNDVPYIIEVAARTIGGECARLLEYASGYSLESLVIKYAMGDVIDIESFDNAAGVLMIPTPRSGILRRIEGILDAQKVPHINAIHIAIREGHELVSLPEGASYLGFIFASAESPEQVETALRAAYRQLNVVVDPLWRIEGDPVASQ